MLSQWEKERQGVFCREAVENKFLCLEGVRGTYARLEGIATTDDTHTTTYGWEGNFSVVLPAEGEISFTYTMDGATKYYRDEYVATPEGVFKTYSMNVVRK